MSVFIYARIVLMLRFLRFESCQSTPVLCNRVFLRANALCGTSAALQLLGKLQFEVQKLCSVFFFYLF